MLLENSADQRNLHAYPVTSTAAGAGSSCRFSYVDKLKWNICIYYIEQYVGIQTGRGCKHNTDKVPAGQGERLLLVGSACVRGRGSLCVCVCWHMQKSRTKCVAKFNLVGFLFTLPAYWHGAPAPPHLRPAPCAASVPVSGTHTRVHPSAGD